MSECADFLLEIGCEDLPTLSIKSIRERIKTHFDNYLLRFSIVPEDYSQVYVTSRRVILLQKGMPLKSEDLFIPHEGPPELMGKNADGTWSKAAVGFANKYKITPDELSLLDIGGVRKWYYKEMIKSQPTDVVLTKILNELFRDLYYELPNKMIWGNIDPKEFAFPRPIRWIITLLGSQVIDFEIAGVRSGNTSVGHRFLAPEPFTVTSVEQYLSELAKRYVVLDGVERRKRIREHGDKLAAERHARIVWDEDLLGVVADQVEYPQILIGEFPPEYAELPRALISATLTGYQKYFPLEDASGKLLPCFLAIYDSSPEAEANVRHGNQSALASRLADAKFFYEHDLNIGLTEMRRHLAGRGYLPGIGTVLDKSERLIHITEYLADEVEKGNPGIIVDREELKQAAEYCKADLESAVVGEKEFASLQGEMGFHYALAEKLPAITALAIREHYSPPRCRRPARRHHRGQNRSAGGQTGPSGGAGEHRQAAQGRR